MFVAQYLRRFTIHVCNSFLSFHVISPLSIYCFRGISCYFFVASTVVLWTHFRHSLRIASITFTSLDRIHKIRAKSENFLLFTISLINEKSGTRREATANRKAGKTAKITPTWIYARYRVEWSLRHFFYVEIIHYFFIRLLSCRVVYRYAEEKKNYLLWQTYSPFWWW